MSSDDPTLGGVPGPLLPAIPSPAFTAGDRVYVLDDGLAQLRAIMRAHGHDPAPNHHGTVQDLYGDDQVLINFDDGGCAPYPAADVRRLP